MKLVAEREQVELNDLSLHKEVRHVQTLTNLPNDKTSVKIQRQLTQKKKFHFPDCKMFTILHQIISTT